MAPRKKSRNTVFRYGSGVAAATIADYGGVVVAESTQPFNEADVSYYLTLHQRTVATLGFFPLHITADAAYDAWYVSETVAHGTGIAAIPLNTHGQEEGPRDPDGVPLCPKGKPRHDLLDLAHL